MQTSLQRNTHEKMFTPTENDYVGISFADLRFHLAIEKQNYKQMNTTEENGNLHKLTERSNKNSLV